MSQPMPPAAPKKKGPLFWILIVLAVLVVLGGATIFGIGYFVYRTAVDAGLDTDLMQRNPALAAAKIAVTLNPDLEQISIDEANGSIKVREKSTGKVVTVRLDPKTNTLTTISDDGAEVRVGALGDATASLPDWLEVYPGTTPQASLSAKTSEGKSLTFSFNTNDGSEKVLNFYEAQVKRAGLEVSSKSTTPGGGMLLAEDRTKKRQVVVTVGATGDVVMSVSEGN